MGKYLIIDTREKPKAIRRILETFDAAGVHYEKSKLLFGDYMDFNRPGLVIDRKQNIAEIAKNCTTDLKRFRAELERAKAADAQLVILIEQNRYKTANGWKTVRGVEDLIPWTSQHTAITGEKVYRVLMALINQYNISVKFCDKRNTGKIILELIYG